MSENNVYLTSLKVENFRGVQFFKAELGQISLILGENETGKTSLLESIRTVFEGGSDPASVRLGADEAIITITMSDGYRAVKTIRRDGFDLDVFSPEGGVIKAPSTHLKNYAPGISWDPVKFLDAPPKERADFLLKTLPLTFEPDAVNEVLGAPTVNAPISLQKLNEIRDGKYKERTDLNSQVRNLQGSIVDLESSLPKGPQKQWGVERDRLNAEISTVSTEISTKAAEIELEAEQARSSKRQEIADKIAALNAELADYLKTVDRVAADSLAEATAELEAKRAHLTGELGEVKVKADQQQQAVGVTNAVEKRKKELDGHILKEMRLTKTIEAIDAMKRLRLKELPIDGFDLVMEKNKPVIMIDGVPLDLINTQRQIFLAMQFVQFAAGRLPLIICECAEVSDTRLADLTGAARQAGLQLILARWSNNEPLSVLSDLEYAEKVSG